MNMDIANRLLAGTYHDEEDGEEDFTDQMTKTEKKNEEHHKVMA